MTALQATTVPVAREVMTTVTTPQHPGSEAGDWPVRLLHGLALQKLSDAEFRGNLKLAVAAGNAAHAVVARSGGTPEAQHDAYHYEFQRVARELNVAPPCYCTVCVEKLGAEKVA